VIREEREIADDWTLVTVSLLREHFLTCPSNTVCASLQAPESGFNYQVYARHELSRSASDFRPGGRHLADLVAVGGIALVSASIGPP